jgi:hypothetical protein
MSPNLSNRLAWTLLMLAGLEGETGIGELLIARGASADISRIAAKSILAVRFQNSAFGAFSHCAHKMDTFWMEIIVGGELKLAIHLDSDVNYGSRNSSTNGGNDFSAPWMALAAC